MRWQWIGALIGGTVAYPAPANLDSLVKNSPFSAPTAASGASADAPLELRGVMVDQGEYFFSLRDPATGSSLWVGLNEPGNPFTVHSYDRDRSVAAVEFKGRTLSLTLKQAKVLALAPSAPGPAPAPAGAAATAAASTAPTDASRLAAVAEEVRRRRALRAQSDGLPPPAAPTDRK